MIGQVLGIHINTLGCREEGLGLPTPCLLNYSSRFIVGLANCFDSTKVPAVKLKTVANGRVALVGLLGTLESHLYTWRFAARLWRARLTFALAKGERLNNVYSDCNAPTNATNPFAVHSGH